MKDGSLNKENEVSKFSLLNNSLQTLVFGLIPFFNLLRSDASTKVISIPICVATTFEKYLLVPIIKNKLINNGWMGEWMMNLLSFQLKIMSGNFPSHKSKETNQFPCLPQHIPQGSYPTGNPMTCAEHKYIYNSIIKSIRYLHKHHPHKEHALQS